MSASGGIPDAALVLIDLETDQDISGRSYVFEYATWPPKATVQSIEAMSGMLRAIRLRPWESKRSRASG